MTKHLGPPAFSMENRPEPKHHHGRMYRCKRVPYVGPIEYGEWFGTEAEVKKSVSPETRHLGSQYYCEMKMITCPECDVDAEPKVISAL